MRYSGCIPSLVGDMMRYSGDNMVVIVTPSIFDGNHTAHQNGEFGNGLLLF